MLILHTEKYAAHCFNFRICSKVTGLIDQVSLLTSCCIQLINARGYINNILLIDQTWVVEPSRHLVQQTHSPSVTKSYTAQLIDYLIQEGNQTKVRSISNSYTCDRESIVQAVAGILGTIS